MSDFRPRHDFNKLNRLPPYILSEVTELARAARRDGPARCDVPRDARVGQPRPARHRLLRARRPAASVDLGNLNPWRIKRWF